jgi:hypothetical protein
VDEQPETAIGPANDETQVVAKDAETQLGGMAWSEDDSAEPVRHSWESAWGRAAMLVSVGTAVATATAVLGWMVVHGDHDPQPPPAHPTSVAAIASPVATAPPVVIPPSTVTVQIPPPTTVTVQAAPSTTTPSAMAMASRQSPSTTRDLSTGCGRTTACRRRLTHWR